MRQQKRKRRGFLLIVGLIAIPLVVSLVGRSAPLSDIEASTDNDASSVSSVGRWLTIPAAAIKSLAPDPADDPIEEALKKPPTVPMQIPESDMDPQSPNMLWQWGGQPIPGNVALSRKGVPATG